MDPTAVCFLINNEIVNLYPQDDAVREKFRDDHSFAIKKIVQLVNTGRIKLNEPISRIALLHNDYKQLIYDVDTNPASDNENTEPIEQNIVEDSINSELENCETSELTPGTNQVQTGDVWGDSETKYVLDQYYKYMAQIGPMKKFRRKKDMWSRTSHDFLNKYNIYKTAIQIENRYKTVLRRKEDAINNNSKSGHSRQDVPYEPELAKIAAADDSIEPEIIRSARVLKESQSQNVAYDSENDDEDEHTNKQKFSNCKQVEEKPKKRKSNLSTAQLIKILHTEKEVAKQRRHEEKMQLMRQLFGNIQDEGSESD